MTTAESLESRQGWPRVAEKEIFESSSRRRGLRGVVAVVVESRLHGLRVVAESMSEP